MSGIAMMLSRNNIRGFVTQVVDKNCKWLLADRMLLNYLVDHLK